MNEPTRTDWKELLNTALEFRDLEPWYWMGDEEVFGVENPETGEIGYCVVMGGREELFGLAVYRGYEGINNYNEILASNGRTKEDAMLTTKAYIIEFGDKKNLEDYDRKTFKRIGYVSRDPLGYPVFRAFSPGYFPWRIDVDAARYLTCVLQQGIIVSERVREGELIVYPQKSGEYFVRVPVQMNNTIKWKDQWKKPPAEDKNEHTYPVDTSRRLRVMNSVKKREGIIELASFYHIDMVIEDGPRPYFANLIFAVDHRSGVALHHTIANPNNYSVQVQNAFFSVIEKLNKIPEKVLVKDGAIKDILAPLTGPMKIDVFVEKKLKEFEKLEQSVKKNVKGPAR